MFRCGCGHAIPLLLAAAAIACRAEPPPPPTVHGTPIERFWELAAPHLEPGMSTEERAIALARWVAANGTNDHAAKSLHGVPFFGLCGRRATMFQLLARRARIAVRRVEIEAFAGSGHSAVEVHYDDAWHFLDVTYAGYFRRDGKILSFAEIQSDPEPALAGMVVFEGTHDRWRDGTPVNNVQRMRKNYTPAHLLAARRL